MRIHGKSCFSKILRITKNLINLFLSHQKKIACYIMNFLISSVLFAISQVQSILKSTKQFLKQFYESSEMSKTMTLCFFMVGLTQLE